MLLAELQGGTAEQTDDNQSEFSYNSSNISFVSKSSNVSKKSGMSSVSVLSNLSSVTATSNVSHKSKNNFSIQGIEHSLLSRGNSVDSGTPMPSQKGSNKYGKKEKRAEKKRIKGNGKDIWGLKKEKQLTDELWLLSDISSVALTINDLNNVLLYLINNETNESNNNNNNENNNEFINLAILLQTKMDEYCNMIQNNLPPIAPDYPPEWLIQRNMKNIFPFQDFMKLNSTIPMKPEIISWWKSAADGIQLWKAFRKEILL